MPAIEWTESRCKGYHFDFSMVRLFDEGRKTNHFLLVTSPEYLNCAVASKQVLVSNLKSSRCKEITLSACIWIRNHFDVYSSNF